MVSSLRVFTALAALGASGLLARADDAPVERPPEPSDDPAPPRYIGADYGATPGRAVTFSEQDQRRILAAQAKRERKAAKLRGNGTTKERG